MNNYEQRTIVKVVDEYFRTKRGVSYTRKLKVLKCKSCGFNIIFDGFDDVELDRQSISNLFEVEEGIYELVYSNVFKPYDSRHTEGRDYTLIPFVEDDNG